MKHLRTMIEKGGRHIPQLVDVLALRDHLKEHADAVSEYVTDDGEKMTYYMAETNEGKMKNIGYCLCEEDDPDHILGVGAPTSTVLKFTAPETEGMINHGGNHA